MRVAVTGATGFIGGHLVRRLAAAGHDVLGLGRRPVLEVGEALGAAGLPTYRRWDLADRLAAPPAELRDVDAVVHPAALVADWGPWEPFQRITVDGTARLIDAIGAARLIVIGSASVYDPYRAHLGVREEEAPVDRYRNAYGRSKAEQERLTLRHRPDALVLRPRAVYGRGDRTLLPRLIAARRGGVLLLPGGGRQPMSITHVDTLGDAVLAGLERASVAGPVNVADATPVRACDLLTDAFAGLGLPTRIVALPLPAAWLVASASETVHRAWRRGRRPAVTRYTVGQLAWPFTLDLTRLEQDLGIRPDRRYRDHLSELG